MRYKLKKSLGQHFLNDEEKCQQIVGVLGTLPFERLLEIGPGGGALTKYLLTLSGITFKAVEIDEEKVDYLLHKYPVLSDKLLHASILDIARPFDQPFSIVGNFPYNISTEIVFKLLEWKDYIEQAVGMFQKEVGQRLAAAPGSRIYGVTSVLTQIFFEIEYLFDVAPSSFSPPPRVTSGVIRMTPRRQPIAVQSEAHLKLLVKTAFNQRRKQLRNAVRGLFDEETLQDALFDRRAEQLDLETFAALTFKMRK